MTKATKKGATPRVADEIIRGLEEALAFERGEIRDVRVDRVPITARQATAAPPPEFGSSRIIDLRKNKLGVSQTVFAAVLNVSPETVRAWEQGKNAPGGPALRLLEIVDRKPDVVSVGKRVEAVSVKYKPARGKAFFVRSGPATKAVAAKQNPAAKPAKKK